MSEKLGPKTDLDVVLCGGTYQIGDVFMPTTFQHSDDFGMLGGELRNIAAAVRARRGLSSRILFSGGKSRKGAALRGGEHVPAPPAAAVYAGHFTDMLQAEELEDGLAIPTILLDTTSPNTNANMLYSLQQSVAEGWRGVAFITNGYHAPRASTLLAILKAKLNIEQVQTTFLSAEDIVREAHPGLYDDAIAQAYASESGQLRLDNEAKGLADLREGNYSFREVTANDLIARESPI